MGNQMPGMNGAEVVRTMVQDKGLGCIPTLLTSGAAVEADLSDLGERIKILVQPFEVADFRKTLLDLRDLS